MIRSLAITLALAGCGNGAKLQAGDYADALTTVHVVASPKYVEIGTAPDQLGPAGAAIGVLAQKYLAKAALIELGVPKDDANLAVDTVSWYWACQNLALFAGIDPAGRVLAGVLCGVVNVEVNT